MVVQVPTVGTFGPSNRSWLISSITSHLKIISSRPSFCLSACPANWSSIITAQGCSFFSTSLHLCPANWFSFCCLSLQPISTRSPLGRSYVVPSFCCLSLQPTSTCSPLGRSYVVPSFCCFSLQPISSRSPLGRSYVVPSFCCLFWQPAFFLHSTGHSASQALSRCTAAYSLSHLDFRHGR